MRIIKIVGINLLILLSLIWVIDHILFAFYPVNKPVAQRHIRLREHPALKSYQINDDSTFTPSDSSKLIFRTDANGYLLPFGGNNNSDSIIFFVGGSTTECYRMPENKRFPYLVGEKLMQQGRLVKTINAGVSGNNSLLSLNIILNKIAPSKPKAIVLMHAINDLNIYMRHKSYWHVTNKYSNITLDANPFNSWLKRLLPTSYFYGQQLFNTMDEKDATSILNPINTQLTEALATDFERNLNLYVLICQQYQITPILMTQARAFNKTATKKHLVGVSEILNKGELFFEKYIHLFDSLNQITRTVALNNNVLLIDLDEQLTGDTACFYDAIHYNSLGSEKVASIVSESLYGN